MFNDFSNVWTPVLASTELEKGTVVGLRIADVAVAIYRDAQGAPAALIDRCPHRGVALSLGHVQEGRLTCAFHGWQFDAIGANCHVPWNPDARRERLNACALPARELAGQIWLFTGQAPPGDPVVHEKFLRSDVRLCGFSLEVDTHWTRAMENMLDWPHLPFVHRRTIGKQLIKSALRGRMDVELDEQPWGFSSRIKIDGVEQPGSLDYRFPNLMNLFIPVPNKTLVMQVACVPVTATRTRLVMITGRNFAKLGLLDKMFNRDNAKISLEDRAVIESSDPCEVPDARDERSVRTDAPTLIFRRRYFTELRGSSSSLADTVIQLNRPRDEIGADSSHAQPSMT